MKPFSSDFIAILEPELDFEAVRSRGPGGQNVNKVSSAAFMSWDYLSSQVLDWSQKNLISQKLGSFINKEGRFYLRSDEYRDLPQNKQRCLEKLSDLLDRAFHKPKARKPSKPTRSSKRKKKETKVLRSKTKKDRQKPTY